MSGKIKLALIGLLLVLLAVLWWGFAAKPTKTHPPQPTAQTPSEPSRTSGTGSIGAEAHGSAIAGQSPPGTAEHPSDAYGSLVVHVLWGDDRSPAEGVGVGIEPHAPPNLLLHTPWVETGADGSVRIDRMAPGQAGVRIDRRSGERLATIEPGKEAVLTLETSPGHVVQGVVVDSTGQPVEGADVWLYSSDSPFWGRPVARTAADGTFRIRCVPIRFLLGARAADHGASEFTPLITLEEKGRSIRLLLRGETGSVDGMVVDPGGRPVSNAVVIVGSEEGCKNFAEAAGIESSGGKLSTRKTGILSSEFSPPMEKFPMAVWTDSEGRFRVAGAASGVLPIFARASGFAPWSGTVDVSRGQVAEMKITLSLGASVFGTVFDSKGDPVAKAEISVHRWTDLARSNSRSGSDGSFRLDGLEPGAIHMTASDQTGATASVTLTASAGDQVRWDARLSRGLQIEGRVVDENDTPLNGWVVEAIPSLVHASMPDSSAVTSAAGRFVLDHCLDREYQVIARPPREGDEGQSLHSALVKAVRPGPSEVVIRIEDEGLPSAFIEGAVLDPEGKAATGCRVSVNNEEFGMSTSAESDDAGRFHVGPLTASLFHVTISPNEFPDVDCGVRRLAVGETLDLGTIHLQSPGVAFITLRSKPDENVGYVWLQVLREGRPVGGGVFSPSGRTARSGPLAAGRHRLQVFGKLVAHAEYDFEVRANEETHLDVEVRPGIAVSLSFPGAGESPPPADLRVILKDLAGHVVRDDQVSGTREGPPALEVSLAFGRYRVEAVAESGQRADGSFEITKATPAGSEFTFPLR